MVFIRDLDPDEHVYANPVSSLLQQVGKASKRFLCTAVKEIKHRIQARQARKKHRTPSFVRLPPRHCGRTNPSPRHPPILDTSSCQRTRRPDSNTIYHHLDRNKSYESMAQIRPLRRLYVTNPDVPKPLTAVDNLSISSSSCIARHKRNIIPSTTLRTSFHPLRSSQSRRSLDRFLGESISTTCESVDLPLFLESVPPQRVDNMDATSSRDAQRSLSMCLSPDSRQDPVSTASASLCSSQAACSKPAVEITTPRNSRLNIDAPIRGLRSSRGRRLSGPPRIPSLYFRAGSPFDDRNLPWNRLNDPESNNQPILSRGHHG